MKAELIAALETVCPGKVFLQGTISESESYPSEFITFWINGSNYDVFYDDAEHSAVYSISVFYYTDDPSNMSTKPAQIITALKTAGFKVSSPGGDLPSDVVTHTGWMLDVTGVDDLDD